MDPKTKLFYDLVTTQSNYNFYRTKYASKLGEIFHHKSAVDLAKLSLNPDYAAIVNDYINLICLPEFKQKYKEEQQRQKESQLAEKTQQADLPPSLDSCKTPAEAERLSLVYGILSAIRCGEGNVPKSYSKQVLSNA